jgi:hypothetical protein
MNRFAAIAALTGILLVRCSSVPESLSGGTVIPNLVMGSVVYGDSRPAQGKAVRLMRIVIGPDGDSVAYAAVAFTDKNGGFEFGAVADGKYLLTCTDSVAGLSACRAKFEKRSDSVCSAGTMTMRPPVTLVGRIIGGAGISCDGVRVFVPGLTGRVQADTAGIYRLTGVPPGHFDLAAVSGNTVNFMPATVSAGGINIVYVKDLQVELQGNSLNNYAFYDHSLDYSCSVLPVGYKAECQPAWYSSKDFSGVEYFAVYGDSLREYAPQFTMLFITGSDAVWSSDAMLIDRIEKEMGFSVFVAADNAVSITDTAGMDVIYLSSSIMADTLLAHAAVRDVRIPVVSSEDNYFPYLMMTDSVEGVHFGDAWSDGYVKIALPDHDIAAGLTGYVRMVYDEAAVSWGKPLGEADVIATYPGYDSIALVFCFEQGAVMAGGFRAPARRAGHFFTRTNYTVRHLTCDGWTMFRACVEWALGNKSGGQTLR